LTSEGVRQKNEIKNAKKKQNKYNFSSTFLLSLGKQKPQQNTNINNENINDKNEHDKLIEFNINKNDNINNNVNNNDNIENNNNNNNNNIDKNSINNNLNNNNNNNNTINLFNENLSDIHDSHFDEEIFYNQNNHQENSLFFNNNNINNISNSNNTYISSDKKNKYNDNNNNNNNINNNNKIFLFNTNNYSENNKKNDINGMIILDDDSSLDFANNNFNNSKNQNKTVKLNVKMNGIIKKIKEKYNRFQYFIITIKTFLWNLLNTIKKSDTYLSFRIKYRMFLQKYFTFGKKPPTAHGFASLGGMHADWRVDLTLHSKTRFLKRLKEHNLAELRIAKQHFIGDHELIISYLDYTIDSSGLFVLTVLYDFHKMHWFIIVFLEMTLFVVFGAFLNLYVSWIIRNVVLILITVLFGCLTYYNDPHTENFDKWFDFIGRSLIIFFAFVSMICAQLIPFAANKQNTSLYDPTKTSVYFNTFGGGLSLYQFLDLILVLFFYSFFIYILHSIGFFNAIQRTIKTIKYSMHDHIFDFLIDKISEKTIGFENIFSGLQFLQQWDDLIYLQRRYAFVTWPDVRPSHLITFWNKIFEVKWAAFFNLTINNLRSSLDLTLLHTVIYLGESEIAKWLIHTNPKLLLCEDSQKDTPVAIALKECSHFVLLYSEQNDGFLDDETFFSDEAYGEYYPEVEEVRDETFQNGEFIQERSEIYFLSEKELIVLKEKFYFIPIKESIKNTAEYLSQNTSGNKVKNSELYKQQQKALENLDTDLNIKSMNFLDLKKHKEEIEKKNY